MRYPLAIVAVFSIAVLGCGTEIGDSCSLSSDCSPQGDRFCDTSSPGGYCTVIGCDYNNCPDDSVCIRFFSLAETNITCVQSTEDRDPVNAGDPPRTNDCTADELCTLSGHCMPRSAEFRFCMRNCESGGDCRGGYECRNEALMKLNGGEPVPRPGTTLGGNLQNFCAPAPADP